MRRIMAFVLALLTAMAAFRFISGLAGLWQGAIALPVLLTLHRLTGMLPFPALELLLPFLLIALLHHRARPVALALIMGMYALLWYPAYFTFPEPRYEAPGTEQLCVQLIDALNASDLAFEDPFDDAAAVAGLPEARVKPARYPEWMRAMDIAGVFVPWTGEALVDSGASAGYLPFTCVHELMHLKGIADEGAANIAAYRACTACGGMFADSARLWALRYALGRLDADTRDRLTRRMKPELRALSACAAPRSPSPLACLLGIGDAVRDYDAVLGWLTSAGGI